MSNEYIAIAFVTYMLVGLSIVGYAAFRQRANIFRDLRGLGILRQITVVVLLCMAFVMCAMLWPIFFELRIAIYFDPPSFSGGNLR